MKLISLILAAMFAALLFAAGCSDSNSPKPPVYVPAPNLAATISSPGFYADDDDRGGDDEDVYQAVDVCVYNYGDGAASNVVVKNIEILPSGLQAEVSCDGIARFMTNLITIGDNDHIGIWPASKPGLAYEVGSTTFAYDGAEPESVGNDDLMSDGGLSIDTLAAGQTVTVRYRYIIKRR